MATLLLIFIYIFYIGLGIPDSLLGAAWPAIYPDFHIPVSYASYISAVISIGTVISSLSSSKLIARLGTAKVTAISTTMAAIALLGFSCSQDFIWLCICAVPLGLGAGSIDTALNNYVALHYNAMQMSFLHCFYGIGVSLSPYFMSLALTDNMNWRKGYMTAFFFQLIIALLSFLSLPIWKKMKESKIHEHVSPKSLPIIEAIKLKKLRSSCGTFWGISALESSCLIWGSTFLVEAKGFSAETAAKMITLYFIGLAAGRFISGFLSLRFSEWQIIAVSHVIVVLAIMFLFIPIHSLFTILGLFLIGLGNGPIFPYMTHLTPKLFGIEQSQAIIGFQMACSYLSILLTPILFGIIAQWISIQSFPIFLLIMFLIMLHSTLSCKK